MLKKGEGGGVVVFCYRQIVLMEEVCQINVIFFMSVWKYRIQKKEFFLYFQSLEYAEEELRRSLELLADNIKGEDSDSLGSSKKRKLASCEIWFLLYVPLFLAGQEIRAVCYKNISPI